jgi:hypothetical protein
MTNLKTDDFLSCARLAPAGPAVSANAPLKIDIGALPANFQGVVQHLTKVYNVPQEFIALAALTAVGAALGGNVKFKVFSHENRPCLWLMVVAKSGGGKTAPMREILRPLQKIDKAMVAEYRKKYAEWRDAESQLKKGDLHSPKPIKQQIICSKSTGAAREQILNDNPRGALLFRDELRAFFKDLNSYGGTSDVEDMLSIYQSEPLKVDRVSDDNIRYADAPFMPIMGGIQTSVMRETFCNDFIKNGFFARFMIVDFEPTAEVGLGDAVARDIAEMWEAIILRAYEIGSSEIVLTATEAGRAAYKQGFDALMKKAYMTVPERDEEYNEYRSTAISKVAFSVARLALIAHVLKHLNAALIPPIDADAITWAYNCAPYLCASQMRAYDLIVGMKKKKEMSVTEIYRAVADLCVRRGTPLNQSLFAQAVGDSQPHVSRALKNN